MNNVFFVTLKKKLLPFIIKLFFVSQKKAFLYFPLENINIYFINFLPCFLG